MLDPIKNAKSVGILIIVGTFLSLLGLPLAMALSNPIEQVLTIVDLVLQIITATGLIMSKRWGIYALGIALLLNLLSLLVDWQSNGVPNITNITFFIILTVVFFWFYSKKQQFR